MLVKACSFCCNCIGLGLGNCQNFRKKMEFLKPNLRRYLTFPTWSERTAVINHIDVIGVALFLSTALRVLNVQLGERSRLAWLRVEAVPLLQSDDLLKKAYNRPSQDVNGSTQKSPRWLISKNAIVSGLGLLGIKQGNVDSVEGEAGAPKVRRKRIGRKKVTA
ncbi:hypothetical protein WN943_006488 [Citrus x changshan-huyou]